MPAPFVVASIVSASTGFDGSRRSYRRSCPREVARNRSSPRPSSLSAVISPSTGGVSACRVSSLRLGPIRAFFSCTDWSRSSAGATWATDNGPPLVVATASRTMGRRRSGSTTEPSPNFAFGVRVRPPSVKAVSNATSTGRMRPSDVPTT